MVSANNAINDTVGASISGVTNTLTITNPSNTASSQAQNLITVGGDSSGDPWAQWTVGTTTSYALGIDNSDSDALKLRYSNSASVTPSSGTTFSKTTVGGVRTMPLQPIFYVNLITAPLANVTGDGTIYTVLFNNTSADRNSNISTNNTFTAPVTGLYHFGTTLRLSGLTSAHTTGRIIITQNGSANIDFQNNTYNTSVGGVTSIQTHGLLLASGGDTFTVRLQVSGGAQTVSIQDGSGISNFYGYLLY